MRKAAEPGTHFSPIGWTRMRIRDTFEAPTAYLFQCKNDSALFAVSLHRNADNIPFGTAWYGGWRLRSEFALDLDDRAQMDIVPQPILRGVRSVGYYIWRNGRG